MMHFPKSRKTGKVSRETSADLKNAGFLFLRVHGGAHGRKDLIDSELC